MPSNGDANAIILIFMCIYRERKKADAERKSSDDGKWKMMFSKDAKKEAPIQKQHAFPADDEQDSDNGVPERSRKSSERKDQPTTTSTSRSSRYDEPKSSSSYVSALPPIAIGPPVLDKFGNFRRAGNVEQLLVGDKPPEPPYRRSSRSRSRSRSGSRRSRSRSHSRSRYSRSRSYGRRSRSFSRRRTRSYSRSRSRSGSVGRRDRRRWRGSYYRPRFNNNRGGGRFRNRDYRDFRNNRGRDRWNRGGAGSGGNWNNRGGNRYRGFRDGSHSKYSRSRSRSPFDEHERRRSSDNESGERNNRRRLSPTSPNAERPSHDKPEQSVEEIERMIEKAKKESKDEMIERNRDLVKTSN